MAVAEWREPKTNWIATDYFNMSDWTRIADDIRILYQKHMKAFGDVSEYTGVRYPNNPNALLIVEQYNRLPQSVMMFNNPLLNLDLPTLRTFGVGDKTFLYTDLNSLEGNIKRISDALDGVNNNKPRFEFRLGNSKGIRV